MERVRMRPYWVSLFFGETECLENNGKLKKKKKKYENVSGCETLGLLSGGQQLQGPSKEKAESHWSRFFS